MTQGALCPLAVAPAFGQNITDTIPGEVRDASGAVMAAVETVIASASTGQATRTSSNALGHYEPP